MSYDISLTTPAGDVLPSSEKFEEGGTYLVGGTQQCELNVTYNYSEVYRTLLGETFSLSVLNNCPASATVALLEIAKDALGGNKENPPKPYKDYWAPTVGNALAVINRLLAFTQEHPEGIWRVT